MAEQTSGRAALLAGGVAAILASTCCLGPLILLALGIGGAWIASLTTLEPYRPIFLGVAVTALVVAYRQVFRPVPACAPGDACAAPQVRATYKALFGLVVLLVLIAVTYPYFIRFLY